MTHANKGKAVIVGAGIGGLTAALCLAQRGWQTTVLEQATRIDAVGAGIQISPNGMKVLRALGLEDEIAAHAFRPEAAQMRWGKSGRIIFENSMRDYQKKFGAPYLHMHRADLVNILHAALERHQPGTVKTGHMVTGYHQDENAVSAILAGGVTKSGQVLIGADGIKSSIRQQMRGAEKPHFTGNVAWRAVVPMARLQANPPPPTACVWVGAGKHAVTYRLRGGTLANLVGVVERNDWRNDWRDDWHEESWTGQGTRAEALADFAGWNRVVTDMIAHADAHFRWALFDRAPVAQWVDGRAALLGDACHPMLPFMAQGAVQAIEDAYVLADQLAHAQTITAGLMAYADARKPRTAKVQAAARHNMRLFHQRTPLGKLFSYGPIWLAGKIRPDIADKRFGWLYGHDVTSQPDPVGEKHPSPQE